MTFPRTLAEAGNMATMHDLRFILGEIDINVLGNQIRADLFERRDGQWSWSAEVTTLVVKFDDRGNSHDGPAAPVRTGPHLLPSESEAVEAALAWIRARLA